MGKYFDSMAEYRNEVIRVFLILCFEIPDMGKVIGCKPRFPSDPHKGIGLPMSAFPQWLKMGSMS